MDDLISDNHIFHLALSDSNACRVRIRVSIRVWVGLVLGLVLWLGFDLFGVILPDFSTKQSSYNRSVPDLYQSNLVLDWLHSCLPSTLAATPIARVATVIPKRRTTSCSSMHCRKAMCASSLARNGRCVHRVAFAKEKDKIGPLGLRLCQSCGSGHRRDRRDARDGERSLQEVTPRGSLA